MIMNDWVLIREPFFHTVEDAAAFIESELPGAVPAGWEVKKSEDPLCWIIFQRPRTMDNYRVKVSRGLDLLIFFYGNSDHGAFGLHHVLHTALVIETRALRGFTLGECVKELFQDPYQPNRLGRT
jgi:hypothetical protein